MMGSFLGFPGSVNGTWSVWLQSGGEKGKKEGGGWEEAGIVCAVLPAATLVLSS